MGAIVNRYRCDGDLDGEEGTNRPRLNHAAAAAQAQPSVKISSQSLTLKLDGFSVPLPGTFQVFVALP